MFIRVAELPYSEVCMHMKVAGKPALVELLPANMAQLYIDEVKFSMPITRGEAGVPYDEPGIKMAELVTEGFHAVAEEVKINKVIVYGFDRPKHPPVNPATEASHPMPDGSPCDGKTGYIVSYQGWEATDGRFILLMPEDGRYSPRWGRSSLEDIKAGDVTPEFIYALAPEFNNPDEECVNHWYEILIPGMGVFDFCEDEIEEEEAVANTTGAGGEVEGRHQA